MTEIYINRNTKRNADGSITVITSENPYSKSNLAISDVINLLNGDETFTGSKIYTGESVEFDGNNLYIGDNITDLCTINSKVSVNNQVITPSNLACLSNCNDNIQTKLNTLTNSVGAISSSGGNTIISSVVIFSDDVLLNDGSNLTQRLGVVDANITSNTTNITTNATNITTNTTNITTNTNDILTNKNNILSNSTNITTNTNDILTNKTNIDSINANIITINNNLTTDENNIITLQNNQNSIQTDLVGVHTSLNNLINEDVAISNNLSTLNTTVNNIKNSQIIDETNILSNTTDIATNTTQINNILNNNIQLLGNKTINNLVSTTQLENDNSLNVATTNYVDRAINNLINGADASLNTLKEIGDLLTADSNNITAITNNMVDINSNQNINGIKTFTTSPNVPNLTGLSLDSNIPNKLYVDTGLNLKQDILTYDSLPTNNSNKIVNSGNIYNYFLNYTNTNDLNTLLNSYLLVSSATSTYQTIANMGNYVLSSSLTTTLNNYVLSSSLATTLNNYVLSSSLTTTLNNYVLSSSLATSLSSYFNLSGNNVITGNNSFNGVNTLSQCGENSYNAGSGGNLSLNYNNIKGIINYTPTTNFLLTLSNVPTTNTNATYSLMFIHNAKFFCNTITINGISYTIKAGGGLANIVINSNATQVFQSINISFLNSSSPVVFTNVNSMF